MDAQSKLERAQLLIKNVNNLPTIPVICMRVASLLDNPDVELKEVADLILTDQVMAARVIKIVNSPLFKPLHEIRSIKQALIYLGFHRIREIALTCSIIRVFEEGSSVFDVRTFWQHSFGVGTVAKIIAQRVRYPEVEKAYICGILHDIGEVVLSNYLNKEFQQIVERVSSSATSFFAAETELLGTSHCEIGLQLAAKWNFPSTYCDVIAHHHEPQDASIDPELVAIVNLADLFCSVRNLGYGSRGWVSFNLAEEAAWGILQQYSPRITDLDVERFCFELDERVEEIRELVEALFEK